MFKNYAQNKTKTQVVSTILATTVHFFPLQVIKNSATFYKQIFLREKNHIKKMNLTADKSSDAEDDFSSPRACFKACNTDTVSISFSVAFKPSSSIYNRYSIRIKIEFWYLTVNKLMQLRM